jgi:hypothetical protein
MIRNLFQLFFLLISFQFFGQVYPVQITPIFNTPYSSRVSDYATSMDVKMQLLINPSDISITNRQVRLKMYLQGNNINAQSVDYVSGINPIYINGGELLTLTNLDIAALFRLENLQGISPAQYANALPEGMYNVCFEMYDYLTNQRISQKSCAYLYLMLNDPPLLNTPARNESIAVSDFPNILFTWTPRQLNATNVSYQFEIKEILDPTIDPQIGFLTSPTLYEETLYSTALLYDISKPNLIAGKRYAWRVRAMSTSGLSLNNVFKNEGYSEIFHFTYASHCPAPTFILSEALSARSVRISWLGDNSHTKYHIQYKKANVSGAEWFEVYTLNTQTTLSDLEAGVTYEFRVGGSCEPAVLGNTASFTYSGINQFSMPASGTTSSSFTCGLNPAVAIANQTPINNLIVSETFTAGDFPVKILELLDANPVPKPDPITNITNYIHSGQYSGKGYIIVPYLADTKIAVIFNNITVNTNYQLINGIVETSYNPDAPNISDLEDVTGGNNGETVTQTVPFEIVSVTINPNGDIIVSGPNGEQITIPGGIATQITDSGGHVYDIDADGNVTSNQSSQNNLVNQVVLAAAASAAKIDIKFIYKQNEFSDGGELPTMLHKKNLKIEIINKDNTKPFKIENAIIKFNDNPITVIKENNKFFVNIKADSLTLKNDKNDLKVLDSLGKKTVSKLKIIKYYAPIVKFSKPDNYNGEFLFDDGFERHIILKDSKYYSTFKVGKTNQTYYTPVLGLKRTQIKTIKVDLTDFESIAKDDPDFKLIIKPTINNKIKINTLDSLVINAKELSNLKEIQIEAIETIDITNLKNLTSMFIECKIRENDKKVGQIQYFCATPVRKRIKLIYTKFSDDTSFPSPYSANDLQDFLNNNSHNQLFIDYTVVSENFDVTTSTKKDFVSTKSTMEALYLGLLNLKYGTPTVPIVSLSYLPPGIDSANDFYFITNLEKVSAYDVDGTTPTTYIGGGHFMRANGGLFLKTHGSIYNETNLETDSHEFGHWVGLPHTFEERSKDGTIITKPHPFFKVHLNKGESLHNFMDYNIRRKTFYKIQLLNRNTTSN